MGPVGPRQQRLNLGRVAATAAPAALVDRATIAAVSVGSYLLRLMHRPALPRGVKLGDEERLSVEIADQLRIWTLEARLRCVWFKIENELPRTRKGNSRWQAICALLVRRAKGVHPGIPDYAFIGHDGGLLVEIKRVGGTPMIAVRAGRFELATTAPGVLSPQQRDFRLWACDHGVACIEARSLTDVSRALREKGWLR